MKGLIISCDNHVVPVSNVSYDLNPSNAKATFVQSTRAISFLKTILTLSTGIYWKAPVEYSHKSTNVPGSQSFIRFFASFCIGQLSNQQHKGLILSDEWKPCDIYTIPIKSFDL